MGTMLSMPRCFTLVALCTKDLTLAHMLLGGGGAHPVSIRLSGLSSTTTTTFTLQVFAYQYYLPLYLQLCPRKSSLPLSSFHFLLKCYAI